MKIEEMKIEVKRITDSELFRECAEMTTGKPCKMSWNKALCSGHSIIRAQEYLIKLFDIPQCVCQHLVRHIHAQPYVLSKRPDRGGLDFRKVCEKMSEYAMTAYNAVLQGDKETAQHETLCLSDDLDDLPNKFDRHAPTNMALKLNAEEIINISKVRLCRKASEETREVWKAVLVELAKVDQDLAWHCHPTCVFRGGICPEPKGCGFNKTELFNKQLENYKKLFQQ